MSKGVTKQYSKAAIPEDAALELMLAQIGR
jgi:hypothetical protein